MKNALLVVFLVVQGMGVTAQSIPDSTKKVLGKYACSSCHALEIRLIGPSWKALAQKKYSAKKLGNLLRQPVPSNWPDYPPMAPILHITDAEVKILADWLKKI